MSLQEIDTFWRPAYETFAGFAWLIASLVTGLFGFYGDFGLRFLLLASIPMFLFASIRFYQGISIWSFRARLFSIADLKVSLIDVINYAKKYDDKLYCGHGFLWEQDSTQKAMDYNDRTTKFMKPPQWYMSLRKKMGFASKRDSKGYSYVHGIGDHEEPVFSSLSDRVTHHSIGGSTGTGKGRVLALDVIQAIVRGEAGLFLDPKGDDLLADTAYATMKFQNKEDMFYFFNPGLPQSSVRINPLANFEQVSHITDRIISLMPESSDESFKNFAWEAVQILFSSIILLEGQPTLYLLKKALEGDMYDMLYEVGCFYLLQFKHTKKAGLELSKETDTQKGSAKFTLFYEEYLKSEHPNDTVESLIGVCSQDQKHYKKLILNIKPILEMLTQGPLRSLLSPVQGDDDPRPIINLKKLSDTHGFLYVFLNSLSDQIVGSYIGSLLVADSVSVAAMRHSMKLPSQVVFNIWIDEAAEIINKKAVMIANKTRSAEVALTLAFQTVSDIEVRLQTFAAAEMMLGNMVTKSQLRADDQTTREYMSNLMGSTKTKVIDYARTTQTTAMRDDIDFNTGYNKSIRSSEVPKVSPMSIMALPDLHLFSAFAGGVIYKLRVPYISIPKHLCYPREKYSFDAHGRRESIDVMTRKASAKVSFV